mmetsp:Transcript_5719/g.10270  ORF Transcript_5719/g.10270 Transcript_5719/m.10270 type:complete len:813 (+) Transcript_5719:60-2498(+)
MLGTPPRTGCRPFAVAFLGCFLTATSAPEIVLRSAIKLAEEPLHENLGTKNQAMNVWRWGDGAAARELVVALIHQFNDLDRRADDKEFAVVWESDGSKLTEVMRVPMSCPNVELLVPKKGPYVFEARLDLTPGMLHPECSCSPQQTTPCPNGVKATRVADGSSWSLRSPTQTHFIQLENEWAESIADSAVLGSLTKEVSGQIRVVSRAAEGIDSNLGIDASFACPGSSDDILGHEDVTYQQLTAAGIKLPDGHVTNSWCLVKRGRCSETAKVKLCELSGAIGTIILDHGMFAGDQDVKVVYRRAAGERATKPVLFLSYNDGAELISEIAGGGVKIEVGPSIGGPPPETYHPGSGITVHTVGPSISVYQNRSYPELFATAGWLETSAVRDLMFVCLPALQEIRIYDISNPLVEMPVVGTIQIRCSRYGLHDYRVLDYVGTDGHYRTLLIDPADDGNRLYYYNTENPWNPKLELEIHARFEAESDGLGQVRPGGPNGRYHIMTWHCSDVYCGKNHGDNIYVLDSWNLTKPVMKVPLPMLSKGSYARDLSCGPDGVCLVSLTWDGFIAFDSGVSGSVNKFSVVASHVNEHPFTIDYVPIDQAHLRMYSGAQKVYSSEIFSRCFYVEHADFNLRPLRMGDVIRALQMNEIYLAEVRDYDATVLAEVGTERTPGGTIVGADGLRQELGVDAEAPWETRAHDDDSKVSVSVVAILGAFTAIAFVIIAVLLALLLGRRRRAEEATVSAVGNANSEVVMGRPVSDGHGSSTVSGVVLGSDKGYDQGRSGDGNTKDTSPGSATVITVQTRGQSPNSRSQEP